MLPKRATAAGSRLIDSPAFGFVATTIDDTIVDAAKGNRELIAQVCGQRARLPTNRLQAIEGGRGLAGGRLLRPGVKKRPCISPSINHPNYGDRPSSGVINQNLTGKGFRSSRRPGIRGGPGCRRGLPSPQATAHNGLASNSAMTVRRREPCLAGEIRGPGRDAGDTS